MFKSVNLSTAIKWMAKGKWWLAALAALLLFILLMLRGCSEDSQAKSYLVARDNAWHPVNVWGKDRDLQGFTDELLRAIGEEEKIRIEIVATSTDAMMTGLDRGDYSAMLAFIQPNSTNRQKYVFSNPFFLIGPVLVVTNTFLQHNSIPPHKQIKLLDMQGKVVGIQSGITLNFSNKDSFFFLQPYDNIITGLEDVSNNRIDGFILNAIPAYTYVQSYFANSLRVATSPFSSEGLRLIADIDQEGDALIEHFNHGLQVIKDKGVYDVLLAKWSLFNADL